eukprot:TRINITY_DN7798_c0_g1_i5.p1 TRINITY_DN7798_c0_g1~~TRINITY_DN7798_c0_g1_i5.p1  ORF type:complete len:576 (-),score=155.82 TRINITY_DN7798_c0_g1_i5:57-1784(-)
MPRVTRRHTHLDLDSAAPARNTRRRRKDESAQLSLLDLGKSLPQAVVDKSQPVTVTADPQFMNETATNMYKLFIQGLFCDVQLVFAKDTSAPPPPPPPANFEPTSNPDEEDMAGYEHEEDDCEEEEEEEFDNEHQPDPDVGKVSATVMTEADEKKKEEANSKRSPSPFWLNEPDGTNGVIKSRALQAQDTLPCHKAILASYSLYFRNLFRSSMQDSGCISVQLDEPKDRYPYFYMMLQFMYTGKIFIDINSAIHLVVLCDKFGVPILGDYCAQYLSHEITVETCIYLLGFSDRYPHLAEQNNLKGKATTYMEQNLDRIPAQHFDQLSYDSMKALLEKDALGVDHEGSVLDRLIVWLNKHQAHESQDRIESLWKLIRFDFLPNSSFRKLVQESPYFNDWIKELSLTQRISNRGLRPRECSLTSHSVTFEHVFEENPPNEKFIYFPLVRRYGRRWKFFLHNASSYFFDELSLRFGVLCLDGDHSIKFQFSLYLDSSSYSKSFQDSSFKRGYSNECSFKSNALYKDMLQNQTIKPGKVTKLNFAICKSTESQNDMFRFRRSDMSFNVQPGTRFDVLDD